MLVLVLVMLKLVKLVKLVLVALVVDGVGLHWQEQGLTLGGEE